MTKYLGCPFVHTLRTKRNFVCYLRELYDVKFPIPLDLLSPSRKVREETGLG